MGSDFQAYLLPKFSSTMYHWTMPVDLCNLRFTNPGPIGFHDQSIYHLLYCFKVGFPVAQNSELLPSLKLSFISTRLGNDV